MIQTRPRAAFAAILICATAPAAAPAQPPSRCIQPAPVGIAVFDGGKRIVVTNSNRFGQNANEAQSLTVVDAAKIASGTGAVLGTFPAGAFPRELRVTADGKTLLVTNFLSGAVEVVELGRVRLGAARQ